MHQDYLVRLKYWKLQLNHLDIDIEQFHRIAAKKTQISYSQEGAFLNAQQT